jgi:UDP-glucose 4-epimerase
MRVLAHAVDADVPGTFNVAGEGVMLLSQAVRRLRTPSVSMPGAGFSGLASLLKAVRMADFSPEQLDFLTFGRGIDTSRMRDELGFEPELTTAEAFEDFASATGHGPRAAERVVDGLAAAMSDPAPTGAGRG